VCLHGFLDTWRTWELVLPALERRHDVLALTLAGNSLGGWVALHVAARGRARSVVALAPAGGWAPGDRSHRQMPHGQAAMREATRSAAPHAEAILATDEGRRRATRYVTTRHEHIPTELLAHSTLGVARCDAAARMVGHALEARWELDAARIDCPVRIVWGGAEDLLLPWPSAAA
jgi:pimeloyl-ACP methyl ester carboxylesterase